MACWFDSDVTCRRKCSVLRRANMNSRARLVSNPIFFDGVSASRKFDLGGWI